MELEFKPMSELPEGFKDGRELLLVTTPYKHFFLASWSNEVEFGQFEVGKGWQVYLCEDTYYSVGLTEGEISHWAVLPDITKVV